MITNHTGNLYTVESTGCMALFVIDEHREYDISKMCMNSTEDHEFCTPDEEA